MRRGGTHKTSCSEEYSTGYGTLVDVWLPSLFRPLLEAVMLLLVLREDMEVSSQRWAERRGLGRNMVWVSIRSWDLAQNLNLSYPEAFEFRSFPMCHYGAPGYPATN